MGFDIHEIDGNHKLFSAMTYKRGNLIEAGFGSSTEDNEFNVDNTEEPDARQHESLRYVYYSAKILRSCLLEINPYSPSPPTGDCICEDNIKIPDLLHNFLAWTLSTQSENGIISGKKG